MPKPLYELTLGEIRERLGREPTILEWVGLARAANAAREWEREVAQVRRWFEVDDA